MADSLEEALGALGLLRFLPKLHNLGLRCLSQAQGRRGPGRSLSQHRSLSLSLSLSLLFSSPLFSSLLSFFSGGRALDLGPGGSGPHSPADPAAPELGGEGGGIRCGRRGRRRGCGKTTPRGGLAGGPRPGARGGGGFGPRGRSGHRLVGASHGHRKRGSFRELLPLGLGLRLALGEAAGSLEETLGDAPRDAPQHALQKDQGGAEQGGAGKGRAKKA